MGNKAKLHLAIAFVVMVIIAVGSAVLLGGNPHPNASTTISQAGQQSNSSKVLFASTQYAQYSYLISGNSLSQAASSALSGFNISVVALANGTKEITVSVAGAATGKAFDVAKGYRLYIVETTFSDDSFHFDSSLGDDGFIMMDPNGYVA